MNEVQQLYTRRANFYNSFIALFRHQQGLEILLRDSGLLRPGMRALDAGCGFGAASFAVLGAAAQLGLAPPSIDAFDLTPAMLARFRARLEAWPTSTLRLQQADVMRLDEQLPAAWAGYDLILSISMLEYIRRPELPLALSALRQRLAQGGHLLVMITSKNLVTQFLIEWCWKAHRYSQWELGEAFPKAGFSHLRFVHFPARYFWLNLANHLVVASSA